MPRVIGVTDDELDIDARMHITKSLDTGESEITKLEVSTLSGRGIRSIDLLILQELGLSLPTQGAIATPVKAVTPPQVEDTPLASPTPEPAKRVEVDKPSTKLSYRVGDAGRMYYERPHAQELMALYAEMGHSPARLAAYYGIKAQVVSSWITRLRKDGYAFPRGQNGPQGS